MRGLATLTAAAAFAVLLGTAQTNPALAQVVCVDPPAGLVSWWRAENDATDFVGTNDGGLFGGAGFAAGQVGQAFSFPQASNLDYVLVPDSDSLDTGTTFSIDVWFKTDDVTHNDPVTNTETQNIVLYGDSNIDGRNNLMKIAPDTSGGGHHLEFIVRGTTAGFDDLVGTSPIVSNVWYHGAVTYDGTTAKLYLDGGLEDSKVTTMDMDANSAVYIGIYHNPLNMLFLFPFVGLIDEVEIFDRALTQTEIQGIVDADTAGKCTVEPGLTKELTSGPDLDGKGGIDIAIQINQTTTTTPAYDFELTYVRAASDPANVIIIDTVPAEWDVEFIDDEEVTDTNDAPFKRNQNSGVGVGCGKSESGLGDDDNVTVERGGKVDKKCSSSTTISWDLTPSDPTQTVKVDVTTRQSPSGKLRFKPTSCGKLTINDGAQAFEANPDGTLVLDPPVTGDPIPVGDPSNSLMLVAVDDLDGTPGLVGDGSGDEDRDNLTDADEAFIHGTNPCLKDTDGDGLDDDVEVAGPTDPTNPDTDGDGVLDGADNCPLRGKEETGFVDVDGCPMAPPA